MLKTFRHVNFWKTACASTEVFADGCRVCCSGGQDCIGAVVSCLDCRPIVDQLYRPIVWQRANLKENQRLTVGNLQELFFTVDFPDRCGLRFSSTLPMTRFNKRSLLARPDCIGRRPFEMGCFACCSCWKKVRCVLVFRVPLCAVFSVLALSVSWYLNVFYV